MTDDDRRYLTEQLALFTGGYEHVHIEFDVHIVGYHDELQVGYTIKDALTGDWIAAQVPTLHLRVLDAHRCADNLREVIEAVTELVNPF